MQDDRFATPAFLAQPTARGPSQFSEPSSRSSSPDSISTTSHARWERLRQYVLPPMSRANSGHSQQASSVSSTAYPARPQTPKPSRLARFGLRHVVEQVREAEDLSQRFADDIQKACLPSRYVEQAKGSRLDRDGISASMPHLPMISNPSTLSPSNSSIIGLHPSTHWRPDNRSLYNLQSSVSNSRSVPVLLNILRNASYSGVGLGYLPHETLVLSALLTPFLTLGEVEGIVEERICAVEAFEVAVTRWKAETTEVCHSIHLMSCLCTIKPKFSSPSKDAYGVAKPRLHPQVHYGCAFSACCGHLYLPESHPSKSTHLPPSRV